MPALNLLIKPSSGMCNLNCTYCFYHDLMSKREIPSYGFMSAVHPASDQHVCKELILFQHILREFFSFLGQFNMITVQLYTALLGQYPDRIADTGF